MKKLVGYIVNGTHMDLEWYYPLDSFRPWFRKTIEILDEVVKSEPEYKSFVYDGCVYPVLDAMEQDPDLVPVVQRLMEEGKLSVGPFYTQYDEQIPCGESQIMNALWGRKYCDKLGRTTMSGYLPDNFGHPGQLPQFLREFGIDNLIFMRGMHNEDARREFDFVAPDGSRVLTVNCEYYGGFDIWGNNPGSPIIPYMTPYYKEPLSGYEQQMLISSHLDVEGIAQQFVNNVRQRAQFHPSGVIPLFCGVDHCPPGVGLMDSVRRAGELADDIEFIMGDTEDYIDFLKTRIDSENQFEYRGDLIGQVANFRLFGVLTARIHQKIRNFQSEKHLFSYALPLDAFSIAMGKGTAQRVLDDAIKKQMLNATHDSIHGACCDAAHVEAEYRANSVDQICAITINDSLKRLSGGIGAARDGDGSFLVYLPVLRQNEPASVYLNIGDSAIDLYDHRGQLVEHEILPVHEIELNGVGKPYYLPVIDPKLKQVVFRAQAEHPGVYRYTYVKKEQPIVYRQTVETNTIENEFIRITADGTKVSLTDLITGRTWENICRLHEEADAGDEFDFAPPWLESAEYDTDTDAKRVKIQVTKGDVQSVMKISFDLYLPESLCNDKRSEDLIRNPFTITCTLHKGVRRADFRLDFENRSADHRVRLLLPRMQTPHTITSGGLFMTCTHDAERYIGDLSHTNHSCCEIPFRDYVAQRGESGGLAAAFKGLYMYEAYDKTIAFTVLRSVGKLFKTNLSERPIRAHTGVETPDAQCKRPLSVEWCLLPITAQEAEHTYTDAIAGYLAPPQTCFIDGAVVAGGVAHDLPLEIETDGNVKLEAIRRTVDGEYMLARFCEYEGKPGEIRIKSDLYTRCYRGTLAEETVEELSMEQGAVSCMAQPYKIVTLLFR